MTLLSAAIKQARGANAAQSISLRGQYTNEILPVNLESMVYRAKLIRPGLDDLLINGIVPSIDWNDDDSIMDGAISLYKPNKLDQPFHITHGNQVQLEVKWAGTYRSLWVMRVWDPERTLEDGNLTATLYDDLYALQISEDNFQYRKNKKKKPNGWYCHEILIDIAKRYKLPLGTIAKGTRLIKDLDMQGVSPLDCIVRAYRLERESTGRRFVIRWLNGRLNVTPLRRNPVLYTLGEQIQGMRIGQTTPDNYATALTGRWTQKKVVGKTAKGHNKTKHVKGHMTVTGDLSRGFIHKQVTLHGIDSRSEAEARLKHSLAKRQKIERTASISHGLVPFIRRGDATHINLPDEGFLGDQAIMWVSTASYHLSENPTMDLGLTFDDPLLDPAALQRAKDKAARAAKRKKK